MDYPLENLSSRAYAHCRRDYQTARGVMTMERGQYRVIRVDGTETVHQGKPTIAEIERIIGCSGLDTVTIDRKRQTVMFVDDTGMTDNKPVNPKGTALYHSVCKPGTVHQIHGDVIVLNDKDFHVINPE